MAPSAGSWLVASLALGAWPASAFLNHTDLSLLSLGATQGGGAAVRAAQCSWVQPGTAPAGRPSLDCWRPAKDCVALFSLGGRRHLGCIYQPGREVPQCSRHTENVGHWSDCQPTPCAPAPPAKAMAAAASSGIAFPLQTAGRFIVDSEGFRVKWTCVNWYGAHMKHFANNGLETRSAEDIAALIKSMGFNCIRFPYSVEGYMLNPPVRPAYISKSSGGTHNRNYLSVLDEVVGALTSEGLMVILNSHNSDPIWCCGVSDGNGLWFNDRYSEDNWLVALWGMSSRYVGNPLVVAHDTRNEVRPQMGSDLPHIPLWLGGSQGGGGKLDLLHSLRSATEKAAEVVLQASAGRQLVVVEPVGAISICQEELAAAPLRVPCLTGRLVWSFHDYEFSASLFKASELACYSNVFTVVAGGLGENGHDAVHGDYDTFKRNRYVAYGHIALRPQPEHPIWLGEFGANRETTWWRNFIAYCDEYDLDVAYWALDGYSFPKAAESLGDAPNGRAREETYGLVEEDFRTVRHPWKLRSLQALAAPLLGPLRPGQSARAHNSTGMVPL